MAVVPALTTAETGHYEDANEHPQVSEPPRRLLTDPNLPIDPRSELAINVVWAAEGGPREHLNQNERWRP